MIVPVELYFISETEPTSEHPSPSRLQQLSINGLLEAFAWHHTYDMYGNPALYEIGRGCHARHVCCDGPLE